MTGQCSGELVRAGQTGGGANVSFPQIDGQLSGTSTDAQGRKPPSRRVEMAFLSIR